MADIGTLLMRVEADTKQFEKGMSKSKTTISNLAKVAKVAAVATTAAFVATSVNAIKLASDAQEMQNKFDVTFKTMSKDAEAWAKTFSQATGRSINDTKESISNIADLQQGLGMTEDASLALAEKIVTLGTDLASFNNLNDSDAIEAVSKAMLGEADSAKSLGLLLNVDRVNAYAESQGFVAKELSAAERAQLTYELAVSQSQNAIGDAERSSGSFANQMKRLKSTIKDTSTAFGMKLLPVATKFLTWINETLPKLQGFKDKMIDSFVKVMKPIISAVKNLVSSMKSSFNDIKGDVEDFTNSAMNVFSDLVEFVQSKMPAIKEIFIDVFEEAKRRTKVLTDFIGESVIPVFESIYETVSTTFPVWGAMFKRVFDVAWDVSKVLFDFMADNILPIIADLYKIIQDNFPKIEKTARDVFGGVVTVLETLWSFIKESILPIIESLFGLFRDLMPKILEVAGKTFTGIVAVATILWNFFNDNLLPIIKDLFAVANDLIPKLKPVFEIAFEAIKIAIDIVITVVKSLSSFLGKLFDKVAEVVGPIKDTMVDAFGAIGDAIDTVIGFFDDVIGVVEKAIKLTKEFFSSDYDANPNVATREESESRNNTRSSGKKVIRGPKANGGSVESGASYLVGEKGTPEIFTPSSNGFITPITSGKGTSKTVTNHFNVSQLVVREEADIDRIARTLYNMQVESDRGEAV
ncbi:hypothetical protein N9924_00800 [bacterium]|nr:hypothetical protein [bacterium]